MMTMKVIMVIRVTATMMSVIGGGGGGEGSFNNSCCGVLASAELGCLEDASVPSAWFDQHIQDSASSQTDCFWV